MSKTKLDDEGLRLAPIPLIETNGGREAWAYEVRSGIEVHVHVQDYPQIITVIPLRSIRAYIRHINKQDSAKKESGMKEER